MTTATQATGTMALTYDEATRVYRGPDGSAWRATRRGKGGPITSFTEVFGAGVLGWFAVPGASRSAKVNG